MEVEELVQSIAGRLALDAGKVRELLLLLSSLVSTRESYGAGVDEFVEALRSAMEATGNDELRPTDWAAFEHAIGEAVSSDSAVSLSFKAIDLLNDHQRTFWYARALTDLRPIFRAEVTEQPAAMVVVHTLKLGYREGDATHELFVAMDSIDVQGLITILERALSKEKSLRTLAGQKQLSLLEIKS
ncbi:MAG TPA: hypothetical protein VGH73_08300 [Thermoanaerobaculia bacterium]